jgi:hypothetical protein
MTTNNRKWPSEEYIFKTGIPSKHFNFSVLFILRKTKAKIGTYTSR